MLDTNQEHTILAEIAFGELFGRPEASLSEISADIGISIHDLVFHDPTDKSTRSQHCLGWMVACKFPYGDRVDYYPKFRGNRDFWAGARNGTIAKLAESLRNSACA